MKTHPIVNERDCGDVCPDGDYAGCWCTLPKGHAGDHEAWADTEEQLGECVDLLAKWPQERLDS